MTTIPSFGIESGKSHSIHLESTSVLAYICILLEKLTKE